MVIEEVAECCVTPNRGLMMGVGPDGTTIALTPTDLPPVAYRFNWADFLYRMISEK